MYKPIHNRRKFLYKRKELRNNLTIAEAFLWNELSGSQLVNRKFRRQHSIGGFIVDFYCASEQLIIELDGAGHCTFEGEDKDALRDKKLNELGFIVLRFENIDVFNNLETVLDAIRESFVDGGRPRQKGTP